MDVDDQRILGNLNRRGYAATFFRLPALRRDGRFPTNIEPWPQSVLADQERLRDQCPGWRRLLDNFRDERFMMAHRDDAGARESST
jgi:hypothetical protein